MFTFRNLEDSYIIYMRHILPDDRFHSYGAKIDVIAHREHAGHYSFALVRRHDVRIDEKEPENASDMVVKEIGDCLYPIKLSVISTGKIIQIDNFEEIKERWQEKHTELLKMYSSFELEQYIKASEKNMKDKQSLLSVLKRDAFIQFYFLPVEDETITFNLHNFPVHGLNMMYYAIKDFKYSASNQEAYSVVPAAIMDGDKTNGTLLCQYSRNGDFSDLTLRVYLLKKDNVTYRRQVKLSRDENYKRKVNQWFKMNETKLL